MKQGIMGRIGNQLRRIYGYTRRHADFLLIDLLSFALAYYAALLVRRAMNIPIYQGGLVVKYGFVAALVYLVTEYVTQNLNGILYRGLARETERLAVQMGVSWSIFTVILYLHREAHEYSRSIYLIAFVTCFFCILGARTLWKSMMRYSRMHEESAPAMLIICESTRAQKILERLLPGSFENYYKICGLVLTDHGEVNYQDWYPHAVGLGEIDRFLKDRRVQDAYVELDDPAEEEKTIRQLLKEGITVHRSLGDSKIDYLSQRIDQIAGKSVITIEDSRSSLASRMDRKIQAHREKKARKKQEEP